MLCKIHDMTYRLSTIIRKFSIVTMILTQYLWIFQYLKKVRKSEEWNNKYFLKKIKWYTFVKKKLNNKYVFLYVCTNIIIPNNKDNALSKSKKKTSTIMLEIGSTLVMTRIRCISPFIKMYEFGAWNELVKKIEK